jgi:oligopeptide/dipeptide ABC transporter ATP-binding protein
MALLEVERLSISYHTRQGLVRATRDIAFGLEAGESLALVGETGSGKSTIALALLGLLGKSAQVENGIVRFDGESLLSNDFNRWRRVRGDKIGMVFQDSGGSLNPVLTVGSQLMEALNAHHDLSREEARTRALSLLTEAGIPDPEFFLRRYAGELSGGMCQRISIAVALCRRPRLLIADEPTSALDPSIQAQIMELLRRLKRHHRLAMLLISHSLALVSEVSERVAVLYHGRLVEYGRTHDVFRNPVHPYTSLLLDCHLDLQHRWNDGPRAPIAGASPPSGQEFSGCSFAARCPFADLDCSQGVPQPREVADGHWAACIHQDENRLKRIH